MQFNLLETGYVTYSGTVDISLEDMANILSVNGTVTISGSGGDNITFYGDVVDRIGTYQIRYYFDSSTSSGTVASGIVFSYKNDIYDSYSNLTTNIGTGYYYATVPGLSAPRYIKLTHTVSGTSITGTVKGFEVLNDDSVVNFGVDGTKTMDTTMTSLNYLNYSDYIKEIPIYNSGDTVATAHVFIDPQYNDSDELLSISASEDGPWVFARNIDYIISSANNWDCGRHYYTYTVGESNAWDAYSIPASLFLSNFNLTAYSNSSTNKTIRAVRGIYSDIHFNSKWYWEINIDREYSAANIQIGVGQMSVSKDSLLGDSAVGYSYRADGNKGNNGSYTAYGNTYSTGNIIGVALDIDEGKLYFSKNGVWQGSGDPVAGTNPAYSGLTGTFYPMCSLYDNSDQITIKFASTTYTPPEGFLIFEVLTSDGKLRLDQGCIEGSYTTPIFKNDSVKFAYIDMLQTTTSGAIVAVDSDDYTSTIQIRSSSSKPLDYHVYRKLCYNGIGSPYNNQFWYKDYLINDDTEVYDSYDATGVRFGEVRTSYSYNYRFDTVQLTIDKNTQKTAFFAAFDWTYYSYFHRYNIYLLEVYMLSQYGVQSKHVELGQYTFDASNYTNPCDITLYDMKFDNEGGLWIYLYTNYNFNQAGTITKKGYHLLHLNSNLSVTYYSGVQTSNFIKGTWAPTSDGTSLWYCNQGGTQAIIKLGSTGTIEFSYDDVTDLKGLCATDDGGCWFIDGDNLYKLNSSGILVDSINNLEVNSGLMFIEFDSEDADFLWIVDGVYVKRIRLDGSVFSSIYLEGFNIRRLSTTSEGLWVYCTEGDTGKHYAKYIGKLSLGVEKTVGNMYNNFSNYEVAPDPYDISIKHVSYDNPVLGNLIPFDSDPVWNDDLKWNKVVTENAILPREEYNQLKLTLRRSSAGVDSPAVENIYYQDNVEITNILPGQSKTLYLRISLPDGVTIGGNYESNLRVWWELPVV